MDGSPTLLLCVGQCGVQLGSQYMQIEQSTTARKKEHVSPIILVDSERKVVRRTCETRLKTISDVLDERIITGKGGCGNNWARGRLMGRDPFLIEGSFSSYCSMGERVLECARRALEKLDSQTATFLFHSLGGGTGSGLGAHLLEIFRDELPRKSLYSIAVVPHSAGESPLQEYNCLLSLPVIHEFADACILLANDGYPNEANSVIHNKNPSYTIQDVNEKFIINILGLINPAFDKNCQIKQLQGLMTFLSPDTVHKFISLHQVSSKTASLPYLLKQVLTQKLKLYSTDAREHLRTFSSVLVSRGFNKDETKIIQSDCKEQVSRFLYPKQDCENSIEILHNFNSLHSSDVSSVTLGLNSSLETDFFQRVMTKSQHLLNQGAYLHWYERFGITKYSFQNSLENLQKINEHYTGYN